jgi:ferric-dicitrate binding protein FerR (iron transport regulator)
MSIDKSRIWILLSRKLSGEATQSELQELERLTELFPDSLPVSEAIVDSWENPEEADREFTEATYLLHLSRMEKSGIKVHTSSDEDSEDLDLIVTVHKSSQPAGRLQRKRIALFATASVAVILFFVTISYFKQSSSDGVQPSSSSNLFYAKKGSKTQIKLPDGSSVWLNADSKLDYDKNFNLSLREVHLTGEAFFDVVKNVKKPFIVHTGTTDIKVLGTAFNVRNYPLDKITETSLIRGSVEVLEKASGKKWLLVPNEKLVLEKATVPLEENKKSTVGNTPAKPAVAAIKKLTYQSNDTIPVETYWVNNKLYFINETFSDVSKKMERWYDVDFEFKNKAREKMVMYGTFKNETLQQALDALQFSFGFKYAIENKKVIIY